MPSGHFPRESRPCVRRAVSDSAHEKLSHKDGRYMRYKELVVVVDYVFIQRLRSQNRCCKEIGLFV